MTKSRLEGKTETVIPHCLLVSRGMAQLLVLV